MATCGKWLLLWSTIFFGALAVQSQSLDIQFEHITDRDGLSQNGVYGVLQDRRGLIWIATRDGLNRYDGHRFKTFYRDFDDPQTLPGNELVAIAEDQDGMIWVATFRSGVGYFDPVSQTFTRFDSTDWQGLTNVNPTTLLVDRNNRVWLGTVDGVYECLREEKRLQPVDGLIGKGDVRTSVLVKDKPGLWFAMGDGLYFYNPDIGEESLSLKVEGAYVVAPDDKSGLWLVRDRKLAYFNGTERLIERVPLSDDSVGSRLRCMMVDHQGVVWIGSDQGLLVYDPRSNQSVHLKQDSQNPRSLSHNNVESLFEDRSGVVYVGTFAKGISKFNRYSEVISFVRRDPSVSFGVGFGSTYGLFEDRDGFVWSGSASGVWRVDPRTKDVSSFGFNEQDADRYLGIIIAIEEADEDHLWLGGFTGLYRFNRLTADVEHVPYNPGEGDYERHNTIVDLHRAEDGSLLLATYGGPARFDPVTRKYTYYREEPFTSQLETMSITEMDGYIWAGHSGAGLTRINPKTGERRRYIPDPHDPNALNVGNVLALEPGRQPHILWIGTVGGGLNRLNAETGQFKSYTRKDGLGNEKIYGMTIDRMGHLWLGTNRGITRFEPNDARITNFDATYNLQGNEFGKDAAVATRDGMVLMGGSNGINIFNPEALVVSKFHPNVIFTGFGVLNDKVNLTQDITTLDAMTVPYDALGLTFEFAALDFRMSSRHTFEYQMTGMSKDWIPLGNRSFLTFPKLSPGTYQLRVKGTNSDGLYSKHEASLDILVTPPWWLHPMAFVAYIFAFFLIVILFVRIQRSKFVHEREINEQLRQVDKMKQELNRDLEAKVRERTEELHAYTEELEALDGIVRTINREMEPHGLLETVLAQGVSLFGEILGGVLLTRLKNGDFILETDGPFLPKKRRFTEAEARERLMNEDHRVGEGFYMAPIDVVLQERPADVFKNGWVVSMPCFSDEHLEGFLAMLTKKKPTAFDEAWFNRLSRYREHAVNALTRARTLRTSSERQRDLIETAHFVGVAENARMVLHHMGNSLNSLQTSCGILSESMHDQGWQKLADKMVGHLEKTGDLAGFFKEDPVGQRFTPTLRRLFERLGAREDKLKSEVCRLDDHVNQILGLLREQEAHSQTAESPETTDLNQLLEAIMIAEKRNYPEMSIELRLGDLPMVPVFKMRIMHLMSSLMRNACASIEKANLKKGHVLVLSRCEYNDVVVEICDNGAGVDVEDQDMVFSQSFAVNIGEPGAELHNCANLVTEMGGTIHLEDAEDGLGEKVVVALPRLVPG